MGFFSKRSSVDARARARQSVLQAKTEYTIARNKAREYANEYAKNELGDLEMAGKLARLADSTPWYQFWTENCSMPEKLKSWKSKGDDEQDDGSNWQDLRESSLNELLQASENNVNFSEPKKVFWMNDILYETSSVLGEGGVTYLRFHATLAVPPRALLLTQIRAPEQGKADPTLIYKREHYKFRGGKTVLMHSIHTPPGKLSAPRDFCDLLSWDEKADGTIIFASQSITNCVPTKVIPGCIRGQVRIHGMVIKPTKVEKKGLFGNIKNVKGSEVTFICCVDPKGWYPKVLFNMSFKKQMAQYLLNSEKVANKIIKEGKADKMIRQYILQQRLLDSDSESSDNDDESQK